MRILFLDEKSWRKKVPYTIHYLAEQLVGRGHKVFAIDFDDTWQKVGFLDFWSPASRCRIGKLDEGRAVDVVSPGFIKVAALSRISALLTHTAAIAKIIRHEQIDAIVTYSLTNAVPAVVVSRALGVPLLFHSIDMLAPLVPHPLLAKPAEWLEALLVRRSDCTLALTPVFEERARRIGARHTAVIPNGVALGRLRPGLDCESLREELGLKGLKVVLFVGTFTPHVGLAGLLRAFAQRPWPDTRLVLVGDDVVTQGRERRSAEAECRSLGIADLVIFTGLQPADKVPLYINLADVCISPFPPSTFSKYNIAMKVFEYMACAKPTVCFDLEGTKSLAPAGVSGVEYVGSYGEMMDCIRHLLDDAERRSRLGALGRQRVEQEFSWDQVGLQLEGVIRATICRERRDTKL